MADHGCETLFHFLYLRRKKATNFQEMHAEYTTIIYKQTQEHTSKILKFYKFDFCHKNVMIVRRPKM